ncbi:MAG: polymerase [Phycisphaerales bacterium]|nr:polymerase [Phycisphaerales bacterium]
MALSRTEFERQALEQLDAVDRFAHRLVRGRSALSDDLVQETYLRAVRSFHTYTPGDRGIRPWLFRILYNVFLAQAGRERRQPVSVEPASLEFLATSVSLSSDLEDPPAVSKALAELDEDARTVLTLWAVDELSYKEIAEILDVPTGTVMSRLHRARNKLATLLGRDRPSTRRRKTRIQPGITID